MSKCASIPLLVVVTYFLTSPHVHAQCTVSVAAVTGSSSDLYIDGPGIQAIAAGGDSTSLVLTISPNSPRPSEIRIGGAGSAQFFLPTGCAFYSLTGNIDYAARASCMFPNPDGTHRFEAASASGSIPVSYGPPSATVHVLNTPVAGANVEIEWNFPSTIPGPRMVVVDGGFGGGLSNAPPAATLVTALQPGAHTVTLKWCLKSNGSSFLADFPFTVAVPAPPSVEGWITFETPSSAPVKRTKPAAGSELEINVPLGAVFEIGLQKQQGVLLVPTAASYSTPVSTPDTDVMPLPTATVMPRVVKLFGASAIVQVDNDNVATAKKYVAVHLGTATVNVLPTTTTADPPRTFKIHVIKPTALGTTRPEFDLYFTNVAHNTGIPPQYLKGQARQEMFGNHFQPDNWRYEPCGADLRYVSAGQRRAFNDSNFIPFRLDDAIGVTLHPGVADELDPRARFIITRQNPITGVMEARRIQDTDLGVTAREIWDNNNHPGIPGRTNWNFDNGCFATRAINAANSTVLDFIAQTPTASSSGLLQVMWEEAVNPDFWNGVTVRTTNMTAPKYVFDKPEYVNIGGGSLSIGANKDVTNWRRSGGIRNKFATFNEFESLINIMMRRYNWFWINTTTHTRYGDDVVRYSHDYPPVEPATVFP